ncbi:hypothetical protein ABET51_17160 [Metabacillus fastidiosus]|uniref:hypothetical protein n=1 Tax=Metabacillus fastidiosus TaxID=1458 RepID=UPI002E1D8096|nr:hypothetical protein [Metabacillus fastidiosus]
MSSNKPISQHFIDIVINGKKFDFNDFKTQEELEDYQNEVKEFNETPNSEKYKYLIIKRKAK